MKVGVFMGTSSPVIGGGYTFENEMLDALVKQKEETEHKFVVFSQTNNLEIPYEKIQFVPLRRTTPGLVSSGLVSLAVGLLRKIRHPNSTFWGGTSHERTVLKSGVDIVWCLGPYCPAIEVPYILTVLDLQHWRQPYFPEVSIKGEWGIRDGLYEVILRRASVILTGTEEGKREIEQYYRIPSERIRVLPLPTPGFALEASQNGNTTQALAGLALPDRYLFYPAQFWPHKNHAGLLHAVRLLQERWKISFPVVFVGSDKGNMPYIRKITAQLGLSSQVHYLGFVSTQQMISLYKNAFALVFPTFFGPDNLPPLEAFALGCPVVASNVSGATEQLGEAAILFDPGNHEELALAIKSLYDDPDLRQILIHKGLDRAARWTGRDYVRGVFSILNEFEGIRRCWGGGDK